MKDSGEYKIKFITKYENKYAVSEDGIVYSYKKPGHPLKLKRTWLACARVFKVTLSCRGVQVNYPIHKLVAQAFIPNREKKRVVIFKDRDKSNITRKNLMWATHTEAKQYTRDMGGLDSKTAKITKKRAIKIKKAVEANEIQRKGVLTTKQLAKKFKVSRAIISNIKNKLSWVDIDKVRAKAQK